MASQADWQIGIMAVGKWKSHKSHPQATGK
jgi:hypothetical protein